MRGEDYCFNFTGKLREGKLHFRLHMQWEGDGDAAGEMGSSKTIDFVYDPDSDTPGQHPLQLTWQRVWRSHLHFRPAGPALLWNLPAACAAAWLLPAIDSFRHAFLNFSPCMARLAPHPHPTGPRSPLIHTCMLFLVHFLPNTPVKLTVACAATPLPAPRRADEIAAEISSEFHLSDTDRDICAAALKEWLDRGMEQQR